MSRVDFDDAQHLVEELPGPAFAARDAREDEALPTGGDDDGRQVRDPDVGGRPQVCDFGISTVSDPRVYDPPAIVDRDVVGQYLRERIPVAGCEVRRVALGRLACRVFQPPRLRAQLLEPGERGVDVILFVNLHPRSVGKEQKGATPLQFVPVCVGAFDDEGGDEPVGVERMYGLRPIAGVGHQCPQLLDRSPVVFRRPERDASMIGKRKPPKHRPRLVTIELPHRVHYGLQDVSVGCRFAGEVACVEFGDGGVEVVRARI